MSTKSYEQKRVKQKTYLQVLRGGGLVDDASVGGELHGDRGDHAGSVSGGVRLGRQHLLDACAHCEDARLRRVDHRRERSDAVHTCASREVEKR